MPVYEFTALDAQGKNVRGVIDADSPMAARQKIRSQGQYPVTLNEAKRKSAGTAPWTAFSTFFLQRVKTGEIYILTRQLATLLGAGIPLVPALNGLIEQSRNKPLQTILAQVREKVNEGEPLSTALKMYPRIFSPMYVNMVRAGESSGTLHLVLEQLADFGEKQQAISSRIKAAMLYPIFMAVVGTLILTFLIAYIVPSITSVFAGAEQTLPLSTIFLIKLSALLRSYGWLLFLCIAAALLALHQGLQTPAGRQKRDELLLKIPFLSDLARKRAAARFSRSLASLLHAGVPIISAISIVANIMDNVVLARIVQGASAELEKGESLGHYFRGKPYFPSMLAQMISVGEQSGALDSLLNKAADNYEREVETKTQAFTSLVEPVMILLMGVVVAFIVLSILLPIFEMNQLIK